MKLYDQHVHTRFSVDSEADPADIVGRAIKRGLAGVTFTDHWDSHPDEWPKCIYDYRRLADIVAGLSKKYGWELFIGHGIEICYQPGQMEKILDFLAGHKFDMVMISVHWFQGRALHVREYWDDLDVRTATRKYFETVLETARFIGDLNRQGRRPFDVLGHIDLVKRYTQRYFGAYDIKPHADLIDEILRACIEADIMLEVNVSSLRKDIPETTPPDWVVRRYVELGGRAVVLGSDAHTPEDVGEYLADTAKMLKRLGISEQAVFKAGHRHAEPL